MVKLKKLLNEGKWSKIMTSVRKGSKSGPWSIVIYQGKKVIDQKLIKILQQIPAYYETMKKKYPNAKIGIEDKNGARVYTESVNEKVNTNIKQIYKLLLKYGQSAKDVSQMMKKHWKYVSKKYRNSSPRGVAMALIGLHALGEGMQKQRNELTLHIIDLNNMLGQAKLSKNPKAKKYIKLLQQDLKDAKKKLGKLKK